jgi:nucleoside-diphosphate-sugar epimerase
MATLLIIGGTGFFGKSILDSYKRKQLVKWKIDKVIVMARNVNDFKKNYPELSSIGVEFFNGDISTIDFLPEADFIIHAAASTDTSKYLHHSEEEKNNIIAGTLNYCKLAKKFHKNSRIIYCSSGAVYGYQPENLKFLKETDNLGDISKLDDIKKSYALAKRDSENAIKDLAKKNLNVVIARCFTFVGKYLPRDQHFAIGNFIADGINGQDINVKTDRLVSRSYMYADDLVEWLLTIADKSKPNCPIYNVGSDSEIEIRDLATITSQIFNVSLKTVEINISTIEDRYIPSIEKAKKELGLTNNYGLKESILMSIYEH